MKSVKFHIQGVAPMLLHNAQLSDPLNYWTKQVKEISGKRNKTDDDLWEMARREWFGGMYLTGNGTKVPCMPGANLERMIRDAAKLSKGGKKVERGAIVPEDSPIIYDGPKDLDKLWATKKFYDRSSAGIGRQRVIRTRPYFPVWELKFEALYDPEMIEGTEIEAFVALAGRVIGLSDWRPKHGRFEVLKVTHGG